VTALVIVLCLISIFAMFSVGGYIRYRQYKGRFEQTAKDICDPQSWLVKLCVRTMVFKGNVDGHGIYYSVSGDERRGEPVNSYLLVECPVKMNFRFYASSDPDQADERISPYLAQLQLSPDFRGLLVTSHDTPFLARLISRPLGFGYKTGLMLWKYEANVLDIDIIKGDISRLINLADKGI
jgi:hypothetical protein